MMFYKIKHVLLNCFANGPHFWLWAPPPSPPPPTLGLPLLWRNSCVFIFVKATHYWSLSLVLIMVELNHNIRTYMYIVYNLIALASPVLCYLSGLFMKPCENGTVQLLQQVLDYLRMGGNGQSFGTFQTANGGDVVVRGHQYWTQLLLSVHLSHLTMDPLIRTPVLKNADISK